MYLKTDLINENSKIKIFRYLSVTHFMTSSSLIHCSVIWMAFKVIEILFDSKIRASEHRN